MAKLNARQKSFVAHYIIDRNASKAAIAAGYARKGSNGTGSYLLSIPHIRAAVDKELLKLAANTELTAQMVLDEIKKLAFVDNTAVFKEDGSLLPFADMSDANRKSIVGMETDEIFAGRGAGRKKIGVARKIKNADKLRALEMLAKHFKLLTDVTELSGKDGGPMVVLTMPSNGSEAADTLKEEHTVPKPDEPFQSG